jgi:hypothetical protein
VGVLGLVVLSIALGRLEPESRRVASASSRATIDGVWFGEPLGVPRLLDAAGGPPRPIAIPGDLWLAQVGVSPWRSERDEGQLVGIFTALRAIGHSVTTTGHGLARVALPGGEVLDRIPLDVRPGAPPCWRPDPIAQVVFAGSDGRLHRVEFERRLPSGGRERVHEPRTEALSWSGGDPEGGPMLFRDASWPTDLRLRQRLLVSASDAREARAQSWGAACRLWWVELDADGRRIVSAGRLAPDGPTSEAMIDERLPTAGTGPDGALVLAYLLHDRGRFDSRLMLAPLRLDPGTGMPRFDPSEAVVAVESCLNLAPVFSADGRFVTCFVGAPARYTGTHRVEIARLLPHHQHPETARRGPEDQP